MPLLERLIDRFGFAMPDEIKFDDVCVTCANCGEYHSVYHLCGSISDNDNSPLEDDDISIADAVEVLHREARKIEAIG